MLKSVAIFVFCQFPVTGPLFPHLHRGKRHNLDPYKGPGGIKLEISVSAETLKDFTLNEIQVRYTVGCHSRPSTLIKPCSYWWAIAMFGFSRD